MIMHNSAYRRFHSTMVETNCYERLKSLKSKNHLEIICINLLGPARCLSATAKQFRDDKQDKLQSSKDGESLSNITYTTVGKLKQLYTLRVNGST